jgi:hypothetical protein
VAAAPTRDASRPNGFKTIEMGRSISDAANPLGDNEKRVIDRSYWNGIHRE